MFNKVNGKSIYYVFSMISYFMGVIGVMIVDSWFGKYWWVKRNMYKICCDLELEEFGKVMIIERFGKVILNLSFVKNVRNFDVFLFFVC